MGVLNFCVHCSSTRRNLLPWKIAECPIPTFTFKQFYEENVGSEFSDRVLKQTYVGQTKELMDIVDCNLAVAEVVSTFGRYVKYVVLEDFTFTCGAVLSDLELGEERLDGEHVFVRDLRCYEPLEKLYYSVGCYEVICIYCCSSKNITTKQDCYPQCAACDKREGIKKRK